MRNNKVTWIGIIGLIAVIIGIFGALFQHFQVQATESYLTSLEEKVAPTSAALTNAENVVLAEAGKFARHWSEGLLQEIDAAQLNFEPSGIPQILAAAREAQRTNSADPNVIASEAESKLKDAESIAIRILGDENRQGFFVELSDKATKVVPLIEQLKTNIATTENYVRTLRQDDWNWRHGVRFDETLRFLHDLKIYVEEIEARMWTRLIDDNVEYDLPAAWSPAVEIQTDIDSAKEQADQAASVSREADLQLTLAEAAILAADRYIMDSDYQQAYAYSSLTTARNTFDLAYVQFWGNPQMEQAPNYTEAKRLAEQAILEARSAQSVAATPVPTPTPYPTSIPVIYDDDDDDSGSIFDFGSDDDDDDWGFGSSSSSGDFGSDSSCCDYGSSSDDWGSDDSFGSSDSWGSDDSFGSSDSWGSDDGF